MASKRADQAGLKVARASQRELKRTPIAEAKKVVLSALAAGATLAVAGHAAGRSAATISQWHNPAAPQYDQEFAHEYDSVRRARGMARKNGGVILPDFPEFADKYLRNPLFPHQINAYDVISGNAPRFLHPSMQYEQGDPGRVLMNFPPNHAKSTTFSMDYLTYLIHQNPGICIAIISKTQGFAKKLLFGVKTRLTSNAYGAMHAAFAPEGGWRDPDSSWTSNLIYVMGKEAGETEKDPTVEAVGVGGHIYGGRFDVIVLDDIVDNENVARWADHVDWIMTILDSRLPPDGGLVLGLGTRIGAIDVYSELRALKDEDDQQFFTYLSQPAALDYGDGPSNTWTTLWPWQTCGPTAKGATRVCISCYAEHVSDAATDACDCWAPDVRWCRPRWTGPRLARKRYPLGERRWSLVWQQQQVPDDATFNQRTVMTSINRMRTPGQPLAVGLPGHPDRGSEGLYFIGGLDPATIGYTAMIVMAVNRATGKRWIVDGVNEAGMSPYGMRMHFERLTVKHHINEWVIERNAFQKYLTDDPEIRAIALRHGARIVPHFTSTEKVDPDFGVMSMAPLFESTGQPPPGVPDSPHWQRVPGGGMIDLPDDRKAAWVGALVAQLIQWEPTGMVARHKTDLVMALWMAEIAAKKLLNRGKRQGGLYMPNPFLSKSRLAQRHVLNVSDLRESIARQKELVA